MVSRGFYLKIVLCKKHAILEYELFVCYNETRVWGFSNLLLRKGGKGERVAEWRHAFILETIQVKYANIDLWEILLCNGEVASRETWKITKFINENRTSREKSKRGPY